MNPDWLSQSPLPPITEGSFTLTFARGRRAEFSVLLAFPGSRGPMYPISGHLKLVEFRALLEALVPSSRPVAWTGEYFFGYCQPAQPDANVWFRAHENGITFSFSAEEWADVRRLFQRAWGSPAVQDAWARYTDSGDEVGCSPHAAAQRRLPGDTSPQCGCCRGTRVPGQEPPAILDIRRDCVFPFLGRNRRITQFSKDSLYGLATDEIHRHQGHG